jgi:hypothetical protein
MNTKRRAAVAIAIVIGCAMLPLGFAAAAAQPAKVIASSSAVGFRVEVTATRTSPGRAASADVHLAAFRRSHGKWTPLGLVRIGRANGFFWNVVTAPHSVRRLTIDTSSPERVTLQLLVTPALGWSPVFRFQVEHGRLVRQ